MSAAYKIPECLTTKIMLMAMDVAPHPCGVIMAAAHAKKMAAKHAGIMRHLLVFNYATIGTDNYDPTKDEQTAEFINLTQDEIFHAEDGLIAAWLDCDGDLSNL